MQKQNKKLLFSGTSPEEYFRIKNRLDSQNIPYAVSEKKNESWFATLVQLCMSGTGGRGNGRERLIDYHIYVSEEDYERAVQFAVRSVS